MLLGHEKSRNVFAEIESGSPVQVPNEFADAEQLTPVLPNEPPGEDPERRVIVAATVE